MYNKEKICKCIPAAVSASMEQLLGSAADDDSPLDPFSSRVLCLVWDEVAESVESFASLPRSAASN